MNSPRPISSTHEDTTEEAQLPKHMIQQQSGFVLHHATCEETVELVVVQALSPLLQPSGSGGALFNFALKSNQTSSRIPTTKGSKAKQKQWNSEVLMPELFLSM
jgi:hypothetical protein